MRVVFDYPHGGPDALCQRLDREYYAQRRRLPHTVSDAGYGAGLRISEALALTLGDVDLSARLLSIRESKFYKTRLVPIGPRLTATLRA